MVTESKYDGRDFWKSRHRQGKDLPSGCRHHHFNLKSKEAILSAVSLHHYYNGGSYCGLLYFDGYGDEYNYYSKSYRWSDSSSLCSARAMIVPN